MDFRGQGFLLHNMFLWSIMVLPGACTTCPSIARPSGRGSHMGKLGSICHLLHCTMAHWRMRPTNEAIPPIPLRRMACRTPSINKPPPPTPTPTTLCLPQLWTRIVHSQRSMFLQYHRWVQMGKLITVEEKKDICALAASHLLAQQRMPRTTSTVTSKAR